MPRRPAGAPIGHEDALCLETFGKHYLGFHGVPNTILLDLVKTVLSEWVVPGCTAAVTNQNEINILGVSPAVWSVISDYSDVSLT